MATEGPLLTGEEIAEWLSGLAQAYFEAFTRRLSYGLEPKERVHQISLAAQLTDTFSREIVAAALARADVQAEILDLDAIRERKRAVVEANVQLARQRAEQIEKRKAARIANAKRILESEGD